MEDFLFNDIYDKHEIYSINVKVYNNMNKAAINICSQPTDKLELPKSIFEFISSNKIVQSYINLYDNNVYIYFDVSFYFEVSFIARDCIDKSYNIQKKQLKQLFIC